MTSHYELVEDESERVNIVGAYEAKTHLPRLLDEVAEGRVITITKHGHEVARLVPAQPGAMPVEQVIAELRDARTGLRRGRLSVRKVVEEGRR